MATQQQTDVDEEGVRLIKVFRPAKDAESLFKIDIVSELALYIHMLQSGGDYAGMFDTEEDTSFASSMANKLATGKGVNFAHATTVVMEATRIYSKKVDYLRQQMDLALVNLSSGNLTKASKMGKQKARALKSNVKGISALSDWILPDVNEGTELLHLPWAKWTKNEGQHTGFILPEEMSMHSEMASFLRPQSEESLEAFAARLSKCDFPAFKAKPRSMHLRQRAERKRQCILRPLVELMPRQEALSASEQRKGSASDTQWLRSHLSASKLMSARMHQSGVLFTKVSQHLLEGREVSHSRKDWSVAATPHLGNSVHSLMAQSKSPIMPETARLMCPSTRHSIPSQTLESAEMGTVQNRSTFRATPGATTMGHSTLNENRSRRLKVQQKPKGKASLLLDEHTICGKDVPARQAKTFTRLNLELYNIEIDKITCPEVARLILKGRRGVQEYLKERSSAKRKIQQTVNAWKAEYGFARSVKMTTEDVIPTSLPFFEDVKKQPTRLELISDKFDFSALQPLVNETRRKVTFVMSSEFANSEAETETEKAAEPDDVWEDPAGFDASIFRSQIPASNEIVTSPAAETSIFDDAMSKARDVVFLMHQRVGLWRERVEEWIVSSSSLGTFNVAEYIEKIANRLRTTDKSSEGERSLPFAEIVRDCSRHEVCRSFLTTLILANKHGFKIAQDLESSGGDKKLIIHFGGVQPDQLTADHFDTVQEIEENEDEEEREMNAQTESVTGRKRSRCSESDASDSMSSD